MLDEQKISALAKLLASVTDLLPATWESVMSDEPMPVDRWRQLAPGLRSLAEEDDAHDHEELQPVLRMWDLARLVLAERAEEVASVHVPEAEGTGYLPYIVALCRCVRAWRLTELASEEEAVHLTELADTLYRGLSHYASDKTKAERAVTLVADTYRKSTELHLRGGAHGKAVKNCVGFVAMSNVLSRSYARPEQARRAIDVTDQVLEALPPDGGEAPIAVAALSNNAITSCKWLAAGASNAEEQVSLTARALKLAYRMRDCLSAAPDAENSGLPQMKEACLRHLAELHTTAAVSGMKEPDRHATQARQFLAELQKLAGESVDQDIRLRSRHIARQLEDRLSSIAATGAHGEPDVGAGPTEAVDDTVEQALSRHFAPFKEAIDTIRAATDIDVSTHAVQEALDRWEAGIRESLIRVVAEIGLNHHVCHIMLALGAIASGRLGALADRAVHHWLMKALDNAQAESARGYKGSRQRACAQEAHEANFEIIAALEMLAHFSQTVCQFAEVQPAMQNSIRIMVRGVLREVLRAAEPYVRTFNTRQQSRSADLSRTANLVPPSSLSAFLGAYDPRQHASLGDRPALSQHLRVRRQPLPSSAAIRDREAVLQDWMERDVEKAFNEIPRIEIKYDDEQESAESTGDGMIIGRTLMMNGRKKRVERPLGEGRNKTVYELVDVETGEKIALAVFKKNISEKQQLMAELNELLKDLDKNQDEILRLSDRLLELDPQNESALFNRGNILLSRHDESGALECFRRAIELEPEDLLNWLHAGVALSRLGRHEESFSCALRATELEVNQSAQYLYSLPWMAEALSGSVRTVAEGNPEREDAKAMLRLFAIAASARESAPQ